MAEGPPIFDNLAHPGSLESGKEPSDVHRVDSGHRNDEVVEMLLLFVSE